MASRRSNEPAAEASTATADDLLPGEIPAGHVKLAVLYPHDTFTVTVGEGDGSEPVEITTDGTVVPEDSEKQIRAEAKAAGVTIRKVN